MVDLKRISANVDALAALVEKSKEALAVLGQLERLGVPVATLNGNQPGHRRRGGRELIEAALRKAPKTQVALIDATGMSRSGVSGQLARMHRLGLVSNVGGLWALASKPGRVLKPKSKASKATAKRQRGTPATATARQEQILDLIARRGPTLVSDIWRAVPIGKNSTNLYPYLNALKAAGKAVNDHGLWTAVKP